MASWKEGRMSRTGERGAALQGKPPVTTHACCSSVLHGGGLNSWEGRADVKGGAEAQSRSGDHTQLPQIGSSVGSKELHHELKGCKGGEWHHHEQFLRRPGTSRYPEGAGIQPSFQMRRLEGCGNDKAINLMSIIYKIPEWPRAGPAKHWIKQETPTT